MDLKSLLDLGAEVVCGHVAVRQVHVGSLLRDGSVLLTPDGEELIESLRPAAGTPAVAKAGRRKQAAPDTAES